MAFLLMLLAVAVAVVALVGLRGIVGLSLEYMTSRSTMVEHVPQRVRVASDHRR